MSDPIRWGILGAANFARQHMAPAIHSARGAVLAGLATSSAEKAAGFTAFAPGLRVFESYDALLASPDIDAVYVPLPNHLHVEWTKKALAAGKHVLCEKPITMAEAEFDDLIAARDAAGLLVAEAYMIVHHPQWQKTRDLISDGAIGTLRHVDGMFCYNNAAAPNNIRNRPETGGGGLRDIGVYTFGSTRFVTGQEPESVSAAIEYQNDVDVFAHVTADFPGFRYNCVLSMRMFPNQRMTFHGDKGRLTVTNPFNANVFGQAEIELENSDMSTVVHRFPGVDHYVLQVEAFGESVRTGVPYACPLEFSRGTQRMIDMAFAAAGR
ncbi:Gfo/Idh/MocA family protein [Oceaniovalibus sp. ACAM 378]|uniref:Gfo/Idh/MocA family protein n=1 Tax=Oceaniovalibus sp. ACAM 378 TaxID=2599923 RepID=UPI0011D592F8|nr:Gfo/Idh/MocA family oxidoreductase [Oceaniovalibus sp. ACAM 378]TYB88023.1 Gfo/Idh/MocA family oxidoreductase [Oceaniovalibus sp. ACAM 378]